jgi:hypothetical protein
LVLYNTLGPQGARDTAMKQVANREIRVWHGATEKGP